MKFLVEVLRNVDRTCQHSPQPRRAAPNALDRAELGWLFGLTGLLLMVLVLSGCNTMQGMGEDVEAAGSAMSDTAEDVEDDM